MKKVVRWDAPKITSSVVRPNGYRTFNDMFKKAIEREKEQNEAQEFLAKMMPVMLALLEHRLKNNEPLTVMRPFRYQTSDLEKNDEDDGFYNKGKNQSGKEKFVDMIKTINPGTRLSLKIVDHGLQEFVFEDGQGREHAINFAERNNLMTQTDIFEEVKKFIASNEER